MKIYVVGYLIFLAVLMPYFFNRYYRQGSFDGGTVDAVGTAIAITLVISVICFAWPALLTAILVVIGMAIRYAVTRVIVRRSNGRQR